GFWSTRTTTAPSGRPTPTSPGSSAATESWIAGRSSRWHRWWSTRSRRASKPNERLGRVRRPASPLHEVGEDAEDLEPGASFGVVEKIAGPFDDEVLQNALEAARSEIPLDAGPEQPADAQAGPRRIDDGRRAVDDQTALDGDAGNALGAPE